MTAEGMRKPPNGLAMHPQNQFSNGASRPPSYRRQPSYGTKPPATSTSYDSYDHYGENIPQDLDLPRSRPSRNNNPKSGHPNRNSRSFSARARDSSRLDKPLPPDPSSLPQENVHPAKDSMAETMAYDHQSPPMDRSGTVRSTSDGRHESAPDRSPLQKLEVITTGISKEEKRAKAMEAERRLRERLERKARRDSQATAQSEQQQQHRETAPQNEPVKPVQPPQQRQSVHEQPPAPVQHPPKSSRRPDHRRHIPEGFQETVRPRRTRAPPVQPPVSYPGEQGRYMVYPGDQAPYPNDRQPQPPVPAQRRGSSRRASVSSRPGTSYGLDPAANQTAAHDGRFPNPAPEQRRSAAYPDLSPPEDRQMPPPQSIKRKAPPPAAVPPPTEAEVMASGAVSPPAGDQTRSVDADVTPAPAPTAQGEEKDPAPQTKPKKQTVSFNVPPPTPPPIFEWKNAPVARLGPIEFDFQSFDVDRSKAWWEGGTSNRRKSRALPTNYQKPPAQKLSGMKRFQPPIFLQCGPLLRYAGLKRVQIDGPSGPFYKETWRGSILIVTKDSRSTYQPPPTLRLFSQPMDLLPPPPAELKGGSGQLPPEYVDPTAGLMKLGRDGRPLYVKPVEHTEEEADLSSIENDDGIYELSASILDHSADGGIKQPIPANRVHAADGETTGAYKELPGVRLYADPGRDVTFWKFNIEIELGQTQQRIAYRLNQGPAQGFWVPARGQSMNIMFHTANGFTPSVDSNKFCGPDPLWRDVLNEHQTRPFHVMIGGGDQIFNDRVTSQSIHFQDWVRIKSLHEKYDAPFDLEFRAELESAFLEHYSAWFSQGLFSLANSQIPMVNIWNDHEILEGFGSFPEEFMSTPVISGLGNIAFKYYLLFQHHSVPEETDADEPSWLLGAGPGPYINQRSRNLFMSMGNGITFLGLDCRTERMSDEVISEQTSDLIWDRCHREIVKGETKHLIVLLSIPLAYPRVAMVKNILNSRKSLGKAGMFGGLVNKTGSKVEIFDDHWTAKHHKSERTYLIEDLQDLAAEKSVRVTILSGDVHLAAIGQFYSNPKLEVPKDRDYRYMPNVISSAIADMPETEMISDTLNKRNRVHHLDSNTDEDMIPIFSHDVNNKPRNNKRLLPRRNWCSIREYQPGYTPPSTPDEPEPADEPEEEARPNMLRRTLSLTRGDKPPGGLLRRLSLRGPPPTKEFNLGGSSEHQARRMSMDGSFPSARPSTSGDDFRPGPFLRRPTNLSMKSSKSKKKAAAAQGDDGAGGLVNLEGGLAITLNLELNPKDPSGITTPYKLLVPMLRYDGTEFDPPAAPVAKGWRKWLGVRRRKEEKHEDVVDTEAEESLSDEEEADGDELGDGAGGHRHTGHGHGQEQDLAAHDQSMLSGEAPPENLVPMSPEEGDEEEEEEESVKSVPKRKKWFSRLSRG